jgi:hypothetical protein
LVPRSSGTPVATWAWPTWVVSRRRVLEAVFILLEFPSPSRRIFIGSHSLPPPSLVRRIGPSTSSPMLRRCSSSSKEVIKKVGTRYFSLERYLKSSMLAPSCDLPWIDDPFSTIGCGQGGNHKRWYLVLRVDIRRGLWDLQCGDTQCTDKRLAKR